MATSSASFVFISRPGGTHGGAADAAITNRRRDVLASDGPVMTEAKRTFRHFHNFKVETADGIPVSGTTGRVSTKMPTKSPNFPTGLRQVMLMYGPETSHPLDKSSIYIRLEIFSPHMVFIHRNNFCSPPCINILQF
ncbi:hypothetical protein Zmor_021004 [Zophobas morio]|uniref:Uncharacterized protein n=1 Tax=Zophobas morio TaxID=2755281 RepID=A0AA38MAM7_9CUCU|nr:hypothetical protein Zmor_021004 [Zophobas morio]